MLKILNNNKNTNGPKMFPPVDKETPIPAQIGNNVNQKKLSPIPAKGPINATFTELIAFPSTSSPSEAASSMAKEIPIIGIAI